MPKTGSDTKPNTAIQAQQSVPAVTSQPGPQPPPPSAPPAAVNANTNQNASDLEIQKIQKWFFTNVDCLHIAAACKAVSAGSIPSGASKLVYFTLIRSKSCATTIGPS